MPSSAAKIINRFRRPAPAVEYVYVTDTRYRRPDVIFPARLGA
jgi:hypothetical protein